MKKLLILLTLCSINAKAQSFQGLLKKATEIASGATKTGLSSDEIANGLKEALRIGVEKGCTNLAKPAGFFKNAALKILMPPEAAKVESTLRSVGLNQYADDFILCMNRAAEDACITAAPIFVNAIKQMTISDGLNILRGDESAATTYLRSKTTAELKSSFNPIIKTSLDKVNATKYWEKAITAYNAIPFSNKKINPDLSAYVTEKAMEGIYIEIAKQEKDIRANPMARTSELLKKVFEK
ncbi:MAG: DUF4197 domain-containing protein [Cytophagales bacterium]|nr:DUF4197 domain-containing protein [Cytophagales bacterium]